MRCETSVTITVLLLSDNMWGVKGRIGEERERDKGEGEEEEEEEGERKGVVLIFVEGGNESGGKGERVK